MINRTAPLLFYCVVALTLAGCEPDSHRELTGSLYFSAGSYLGRFDLGDGASSAAANLGEATIQHVSAIDEYHLLVATREVREGRTISRVVQLDTRSNQIVDLFSGTAAWFIPDGDFYVIDDGKRLLARGRRGQQYSDLVIAEQRNHSRIPVTIVDNQELLYSIDGERGIRLFNVRSGRDIALAELSRMCTLDGAVWVESRQMLLCRQTAETGAGRYIFASLSGDDQAGIDLPDEDGLVAIAEVPGQDALILTSLARGPLGGNIRYRVWLHDLRNGSNHRLADDQYLGSSVAWIE